MRKLVIPLGMAATIVLSAGAANASPARNVGICMQGSLGSNPAQVVADMCTNWTPRP